MKIDIKGNPGTGNTFQEYNIQHIGNFNPNATVVNNKYIYSDKSQTDESHNSDKHHDNDALRVDILEYVSRIKPDVADAWKQVFDKLWNQILDIPEVSEKVFDHGKQQGTNFNRSLVANIIHFIGSDHNMILGYNASKIAIKLEGSATHTVRNSLGCDPEKAICGEISSLLQKLNLPA